MPIYEYTCNDCGNRFEWLTRSDEKPACPSCGRSSLTKELSLPAAHVVGGSSPPCPAKETGSCGMSDCCGGQCGLNQWG